MIATVLAAAFLLLVADPALAQDPPDTEVGVGVTSPGDVDLDVEIEAGGEVDVTVDGVDFKETAGTVNTLSDPTAIPYISAFDWYEYWNKEIAPYEFFLKDMDEAVSLLAAAEQKLIQEQELTAQDIDAISEKLEALNGIIGTLKTSTTDKISALQNRDDKIWNQLMYGAEAHLDLLSGQVAAQGNEIETMRSVHESLYEQIAVQYSGYIELLNYVDYLREQYLYYIWILGGVSLVLLAGIICVSLLAVKR